MTKAAKSALGTIKPPLISSAWVVVVADLDANEFLTSKRDKLTKDGSSVTLATKVVDLVKRLDGVAPVTVKLAHSLQAANELVGAAHDDTLVVFAVSGDGDWTNFYNKPQQLDDGFPLPLQSAGSNVVPCGLACFAANAKTRIDYREWLADMIFPGEGVITAAQLSEEILSKVGEKPKFGA